jgi:DNA-binding GntR family transcriptional regulator
LEQVLLSARSRAQAFRSRSLSIPGRAAQVAKELRGVLEAIVDRDADLAAKRCEEHIHIAGEVALAGLSQSQMDSLSPLSM